MTQILSDTPEPISEPASQRTLPPARHRVRTTSLADAQTPQTPQTPASEPVAVEEAVSSPPEAARATPATTASKRTDVGNKRPPKEYQFKPGVSGNPRGCPKGSRSLSTLVDEALSKTINVRIGEVLEAQKFAAIVCKGHLLGDSTHASRELLACHSLFLVPFAA